MDLIRGQQAGEAINISHDQQAHRADGGEGAALGHRERREQVHDVDVDELIVTEATSTKDRA